MEETTKKAIEESVRNVISTNREYITESIFDGVYDGMTQTKANAKMISNCIFLSTSLAVQVVLNLLQESNVLHLDEREIAKQLLKLLSSEIKE